MNLNRVFCLASIIVFAGAANAADTAPAKTAATRAGVAAASAATVASTVTGTVPKKNTPAAGGATTLNSSGNSSIPAGSLPIPPKPKKEGLEQTPAIKANVKAQP